MYPVNAPGAAAVPEILAILPVSYHVEKMALGNPGLTFGELAREQLQIEVTCPNCSHRRLIDGNALALRDRRVAGARFRCEQCGSVGLPELGKQRLWAKRLAEHARKLK